MLVPLPDLVWVLGVAGALLVFDMVRRSVTHLVDSLSTGLRPQSDLTPPREGKRATPACRAKRKQTAPPRDARPHAPARPHATSRTPYTPPTYAPHTSRLPSYLTSMFFTRPSPPSATAHTRASLQSPGRVRGSPSRGTPPCYPHRAVGWNFAIFVILTQNFAISTQIFAILAQIFAISTQIARKFCQNSILRARSHLIVWLCP